MADAGGGIDQGRLNTDYNYRQSLRDQGYYVGAGSDGNAVAQAPAAQSGINEGTNRNTVTTNAAPPPPSGPSPTNTTIQPENSLYNTPNGPRTLAQISQELSAAGYGGDKGTDPNSLFAVYAMTATAGKDAATQQAAQQQAQQNAAKDAQTRQAADAATKAFQAQQQATQAALTHQQDIQNQLAQQRYQLEQLQAQDAHAKALQDLQLARNSDERAQATLAIGQAQQKLAELTQAESTRQFNANLQQRQTEFQQTQYTSLAENLLQGASALRGPADWAKYTANVTGARNLNESLYGPNPSPAFGAPSGYSPAVSVGGVLGDLGYGTGGTNGGIPQTPLGQSVPLPHQWNPAQWDALPDSGKQLVLGLAQAGNTSSGAWDPADYQAKINASRPFGSAASQGTTSAFMNPVSSF